MRSSNPFPHTRLHLACLLCSLLGLWLADGWFNIEEKLCDNASCRTSASQSLSLSPRAPTPAFQIPALLFTPQTAAGRKTLAV